MIQWYHRIGGIIGEILWLLLLILESYLTKANITWFAKLSLYACFIFVTFNYWWVLNYFGNLFEKRASICALNVKLCISFALVLLWGRNEPFYDSTDASTTSCITFTSRCISLFHINVNLKWKKSHRVKTQC